MSVSIDGTSGIVLGSGAITFPDNSTQTTTSQPIGVEQTWQNMTVNRAVNTDYTNTTGRPIQVSIIGNQNNTGISLRVGGVGGVGGIIVATATMVSGYSLPETVTAIIPNNTTYRVNATFSSWLELR